MHSYGALYLNQRTMHVVSCSLTNCAEQLFYHVLICFCYCTAEPIYRTVFNVPRTLISSGPPIIEYIRLDPRWEYLNIFINPRALE